MVKALRCFISPLVGGMHDCGDQSTRIEAVNNGITEFIDTLVIYSDNSYRAPVYYVLSGLQTLHYWRPPRSVKELYIRALGNRIRALEISHAGRSSPLETCLLGCRARITSTLDGAQRLKSCH